MLAFTVTLLLTRADSCSKPWTYGLNCTCGKSLDGVIRCDPATRETSLLFCYCMTFSNATMETVGGCLVRCVILHTDRCIAFNSINSSDVTDLNREMCGHLNRTGILCGACMPGNGFPVYSYYLGCVSCRESQFWFNLLKYICVAFLPLTVFFVLVVLFKISAMSDSMAAYVFTCQVVTMPATTKLLVLSSSGEFLTVTKILLTLFSVWNLDFFRSTYQPFCLHPKLNAMQVIALDYVVAVYPMVLVVVTYSAVALHDRYSLVVAMWRPMQRVLARIRKEWNVRGTLVEALGTFLVLSYIKILNVSFDLLTPVNLYRVNGKHTVHLFNAGEVVYFSKEHLPFAILAIVMLVIFNIAPVLILICYPCPTMMRCTTKSKTVSTFLVAFQNWYRAKPQIYRHYSAAYFIARILILLTFALIHDFTYIPMTGFYFLLLCLLVTFARPYKQDRFNDVDGLFFLLYGFCYFLLLVHMYIMVYAPEINKRAAVVLLASLLSIPVLYGSWVLLKLVIPQAVWERIKLLHEKFFSSRGARAEATMDDEDFFDRLECDEHSPLLKPIAD